MRRGGVKTGDGDDRQRSGTSRHAICGLARRRSQPRARRVERGAVAKRLSEQADPYPGRLRTRRSIRHHQPRGRRQDGRDHGRAVRHRKQDRRRRRHCHAGGRTVSARRLHAPEHAIGHGGERVPVEDHPVRVRQGHHRRLPAGGDCEHPGRAPLAQRQRRGRARQAREGETGPAAVRDGRTWLGDASHERAVQHGRASRPCRCTIAAAATP
jgi:hypothetical protein